MARKTTQRRKAPARPAASAERRAGNDDAVIDAALKLAETQGWRRTSFADIADEAGLGIAELYRRFRSKGAILEAFVRRIDLATLEGAETGRDESSPRDRLFDLFMRRFDALQPHKGAVAALARDLPLHPLAALCTGARLCRSMAWMASVAGLPGGGPLGLLRAKALAAIYLYTMRVWLRDESEDHAKTMAALDQALSRAEMFANSIPRPGKRAAA
ncbi:MAG TPA: TetR family transcriptional regulator [Alphaproteobacteria bacterium]|nr:TetR family transcriptional regulator [Alphaproteobacteria bacterium]